MVFESLFSTAYIEHKKKYAFLLGFIAPIFGMFFAFLLFRSFFSFAAVIFTAVLIIPSISKMLTHEEKLEIREKKFHIPTFYKDHKDIFEVYLFVFLGMFLSFFIFSFFLSNIIISTLYQDSETLLSSPVALQFSSIEPSDFLFFFSKNLLVLLVCFVMSIFYGTGAIIIITWNAFIWSSYFAITALDTPASVNQSPILTLFLIIIFVLPHMITEVSSYFLGGIAGGVLSKSITHEKIFSKRFNHILADALIILIVAIILLVVAGYVEVTLTPWLFGNIF